MEIFSLPYVIAANLIRLLSQVALPTEWECVRGVGMPLIGRNTGYRQLMHRDNLLKIIAVQGKPFEISFIENKIR
jgi:hypothetical protein